MFSVRRILFLAGSAALICGTTSCQLFQKKKPEPDPVAYDPYGAQAANPYGNPPAPGGGGAPDPYGGGGYEAGQATPATGGSSNPYGSASQSPAPYVQNDPPRATGGGGGGKSYQIQPGDNLTKIARQHGTTVQALKSANGLTTDAIQAGKTLVIP